MQQNQMTEVIQTNKQQSRFFSQQLVTSDKIVQHLNKLDVSLSEGNSEQIQIRSHFVTIIGSQLIKLTEIMVNNQIIRIRDSFTSQPPKVISKKPPAPRRPCKRLLGAKNVRDLERDKEEFRVRDTKNIVKNIFRMFSGWLKDNTPSGLQLQNDMKELVSRVGKYNNSLVINVSKDPQLRKAFIMFSQTKGEELIGDSRILDKHSHVQAIHRYNRICVEEEQTNKIRERVVSQNSGWLSGSEE